MKHYGEPYNKKVVTKQYRDLEYITCDQCKKKILPSGSVREKDSRYVRVHTWHSDWGLEFVSEYISDMRGTEELELENEYLWKKTVEVGMEEE